MEKLSASERVRKHPEGALSGAGSRAGYALLVCPKHGLRGHLTHLEGRCEECQREGLVAQGLVKP